MNNLLNFLIKHSAWFVFTFFVIASCWLLFRRNPYQQSVYLTSANTVTATLLEGYSQVTGYFNLRETNSELEARNAQLEMELIDTRAQLADLKAQIPDSLLASGQVLNQFDYVMARVISNSVSEPYNYITINRGSSDGIKTQTGVVSHNGVVGIVGVVGAHASRVISVLNQYSAFISLAQVFAAFTALGILIRLTRCSVRSNGFRWYVIPIWLGFFACLFVIGKLGEYNVQRYAAYLRCYAFMSAGCIGMVVLIWQLYRSCVSQRDLY